MRVAPRLASWFWFVLVNSLLAIYKNVSSANTKKKSVVGAIHELPLLQIAGFKAFLALCDRLRVVQMARSTKESDTYLLLWF